MLFFVSLLESRMLFCALFRFSIVLLLESSFLYLKVGCFSVLFFVSLSFFYLKVGCIHYSCSLCSFHEKVLFLSLLRPLSFWFLKNCEFNFYLMLELWSVHFTLDNQSKSLIKVIRDNSWTKQQSNLSYSSGLNRN